MNEEIPQCSANIMGKSIRVGYHIKDFKMPWSRAPLPD